MTYQLVVTLPTPGQNNMVWLVAVSQKSVLSNSFHMNAYKVQHTHKFNTVEHLNHHIRISHIVTSYRCRGKWKPTMQYLKFADIFKIHTFQLYYVTIIPCIVCMYGGTFLVLWTPSDQLKVSRSSRCPIPKVNLCTKDYFGTLTICVDYAGVLIFKCPH